MNTKIIILFGSGEERLYTVNDEIESLIEQGQEFNIKSIHPKCGEVLQVTAAKQPEGES